MDTSGPHEIDRGYMEFRANWDTGDLMDMTGEQLERLKQLVRGFDELAEAVSAAQVEAAK